MKFKSPEESTSSQSPETLVLPEGFKAPESYKTPNLLFRKLSPQFAEADYKAVMSSVDTIAETRGRGEGDSWPSHDMSYEENLTDLERHEQQFNDGEAYAYVIYTPDESEYIGCCYLYPPGKRKESTREANVDVNFWVTQAAYDQGYYEKVYQELDAWLQADWPLQKIAYSNDVIPK